MASDDGIRVMIINDYEAACRDITEVVDRMGGLIVIAGAGSIQETIHRGELVHPNVVLVSLRLPDGTGIDIIRRLAETAPDTECIVLISFDDDEALAEVQIAGARTYLLKSVRGTEVAENIKAVASGGVLLDERTVSRRRADHADPTADLMPSERRALELIGDDPSNREIDDRLGVAGKTVKNHITSLLSEMGPQHRTQIAAWVAGQRATG